MFKNLTPNRVAAILASVAALLGGLAPVVANMDLSSTIGIVAGIGGLVTVVRKWLEGWQKHEARVASPPVIASSNPGVTWSFPAGASATVAQPTSTVPPEPAPKPKSRRKPPAK